MPTISFADLANDPDLGQPFTIIRTAGGQFVRGGWSGKTQNIPTYGLIVPADDWALAQVPEGDRVTGSMMAITTTTLYLTSEAAGAVSDQISWQGDRYRVVHVGPYQDFGYNFAVLTRMTGS